MAHSEEVKAQAIAALLTGGSVAAVARRFRLPKQTVSRFKAALEPYLLETTTAQQQERLGNLLLSCMEVHIQALSAIATNTTTPEALAGQDLRHVAALHHEISAVLIRLLEIAWTSGTWQADRQRGIQGARPEQIQ